MGKRVGHRDIAPAAANGDDQLHFMMQRFCDGRVRHIRSIDHHGIGRLGEIEGRFAGWVAAHFNRVFGVVAAHAENPAHREKRITALDRQRGDRRGREDIGNHPSDSFGYSMPLYPQPRAAGRRGG